MLGCCMFAGAASLNFDRCGSSSFGQPRAAEIELVTQISGLAIHISVVRANASASLLPTLASRN